MSPRAVKFFYKLPLIVTMVGLLILLPNCSSDKSPDPVPAATAGETGGGNGSNPSSAGGSAALAAVTPVLNKDLIIEKFGEKLAVCDSANPSAYFQKLKSTSVRFSHYEEGSPQFGSERLMVLEGLLCIQQNITLKICWPNGQASYTELVEDGGSDPQFTSDENEMEDSAQNQACVELKKQGNGIDVATSITEKEAFWATLMFAPMDSINEIQTDLVSEMAIRLDQSSLDFSRLGFTRSVEHLLPRLPRNSFQLQFTDLGSDKKYATGRFFMNGDGALEDHLLWTYEFQKPDFQHLQKSVLNRVRESVSLDQMSYYVIQKKYKALKTFGEARNVNGYTVRYPQKVTNEISTYGLSPLMVATVLKDDEAIKILKEIPGIDLELISPLFSGDYTWIASGQVSLTSISSSQTSMSGSLSGGGGAGFSSGGRSGGGSGGGGSGGGGSSGGAARSTPSAAPSSSRPKSFCEDCTALMVAIKKKACDQIPTLIADSSELLNQTNRAGLSALDFSVQSGSFCLKELLQEGINLNIGQRDFETEWVSAGDLKNLNWVKKEYWQTSDSDAKKAWLRGIIQMQEDVDDNTVDALIKDFRVLPPNEIESLLTDDFSNDSKDFKTGLFTNTQGGPLSRSAVSALAKLKVNLNKVTDQEELTIFDHWLMERDDRGHNAIGVPSENYYFRDRIDIVKKIRPEWVTQWIKGQSFFGYNPLVLSAMYNEKDVVEIMNEIPGVDMNIVDSKTGYNALEWAHMFEDFKNEGYWNAYWEKNGTTMVAHLISYGAESRFSHGELVELEVGLLNQFNEILVFFNKRREKRGNPTPFNKKFSHTRVALP